MADAKVVLVSSWPDLFPAVTGEMPVRNRGIFVIRMTRPICDDPSPFVRTQPSWRCNFDRTANIATRIFRRIRFKRGSAVMSAPFVPIASRPGLTMCARTAAADLRRGRSGPRRNGVRVYRWKRTRLRASGCISNMALRISLRIRHGYAAFRPSRGESIPAVMRGALATTSPSLGSRELWRAWSPPKPLSRRRKQSRPSSLPDGLLRLRSQ